MKKILIALAVMLAVQVADAQVKTPEVAQKALDGAIAASKDAKPDAEHFCVRLRAANLSHPLHLPKA